VGASLRMERSTNMLVISLFLYRILEKYSSSPQKPSMNRVHCQHGQCWSDGVSQVMVRRGISSRPII
jgi:hypothetical protein